jgi:hypothetical protein
MSFLPMSSSSRSAQIPYFSSLFAGSEMLALPEAANKDEL